MPSQITTAGANTALAYPTGRKIEQLCDGSYLALVQTSTSTLTAYQITTPGGTPAFTALAQTFAISGSTNTVGDLFILNNGTTTSDVWVVYGSNASATTLWVAHGTYTASGSSWSWDNTGTSIGLGSYTGGFLVPSIVWTGSTLIVGTRANIGGTHRFACTYTTTKAGNSGWVALFDLSAATGGGTHYFGHLLHDATNSCTLAVYSKNGDVIESRVIADSSTPSLANWSSETALTGTIGVGAANISAVLDPANKNLHLVYNDSTGGSTDPHYVLSTYTTTTISAGTPFSVSTAVSTAAGIDLGLDASGNIWLFWSTAAIGSAADIEYVKLASPYASGNLGTVTNLTSNTANDNAYPHVPHQTTLSGYIPLVYEHATGSFPVEYDNSITLVTTVNGSGAFVASGVLLDTMIPMAASAILSENLTVPFIAQGILENATDYLIPDSPAQVTGAVILASVSFVSSGYLTNSAAQPGTGIGDLTVSNKSQTWSGGPGGSPGTETDVTYEDSTGSGWTAGIIPTYGAAVVSPWYEVNNGVTGTNQTNLTTSRPDGAIHEDEQSSGAVFGSSEDGAFTLTEQTPTGTAFRRYYKGTWGPDSNGFNWAVWACIYPGDPGLIAYRLDLINPNASSVALASSDALEFGILAGLEQADSNWVYTNGSYGQLGSAASTWPTASSTGNPVAADPDWVAIIPALGSIGRVTALKQRVSTLSPALNSPQVSALVNTSRLKLKVFGTVTGNSFPASTTQTTYLLWAFRRNLTTGDAAAISADYIQPGTPTMTTGTFTGFSYDERAYVFAAASNVLNATLDMTPSHVTVRYKPVIKVTSWSGGVPVLTWGGSTLVPGVDYRWLEDVTNSVLYVQLYFDVVSSGAVAGQRNNAALAISSANVVLASSGVLTAPAQLLAPASQVSQGTLLVGMVPVAASAGMSVSATIIAAPSLPASGVLSQSATLLTSANPVAGGALLDTMTPLVAGGVTQQTSAQLLAPASVPAQGQLIQAEVIFSAQGVLFANTAGGSLVANGTLSTTAQVLSPANPVSQGVLSEVATLLTPAPLVGSGAVGESAVIVAQVSFSSNGVLQAAGSVGGAQLVASAVLAEAAQILASTQQIASGALSCVGTVQSAAVFVSSAQASAPAQVISGCPLVSGGVLQATGTTQASAFVAQATLAVLVDLLTGATFAANAGLFPVPNIPGVATTGDFSPAIATLGDLSPAIATLGDQ